MPKKATDNKKPDNKKGKGKTGDDGEEKQSKVLDYPLLLS